MANACRRYQSTPQWGANTIYGVIERHQTSSGQGPRTVRTVIFVQHCGRRATISTANARLAFFPTLLRDPGDVVVRKD